MAKTERKMISLKVSFWTNNIGDGGGNVKPKHAWDSGKVQLETNDTHGLKDNKPVMFSNLAGLLTAVSKLLIRNKIRLHKAKDSLYVRGQ